MSTINFSGEEIVSFVTGTTRNSYSDPQSQSTFLALGLIFTGSGSSQVLPADEPDFALTHPATSLRANDLDEFRGLLVSLL